jgi:hypothetical protein
MTSVHDKVETSSNCSQQPLLEAAFDPPSIASEWPALRRFVPRSTSGRRYLVVDLGRGVQRYSDSKVALT